MAEKKGDSQDPGWSAIIDAALAVYMETGGMVQDISVWTGGRVDVGKLNRWAENVSKLAMVLDRRCLEYTCGAQYGKKG